MTKALREVLAVIRTEGVTVLDVDEGRGRGSHVRILCRYRDVDMILHTGRNVFATDRNARNFRADLRRAKKNIEHAETTRSAGSPSERHPRAGTSGIQIVGTKTSPGQRW